MNYVFLTYADCNEMVHKQDDLASTPLTMRDSIFVSSNYVISIAIYFL